MNNLKNPYLKMRARLEKSCARCKKTTIDTYMWNIKALAKVAGLKSVPNRAEWVTKSLLDKIKKLPISQYKRFAMAGVKVLSAFGKKNSSWEAAMRDSTDRYGAIRDKQKRTDREAKNWPEGGYAALKKLADKLHEGVKQLEGRKKLSPGELYRYQKYVIIRFYSEHALRGDLADLRIKRPFGKNYLNKSKGSWVLYLGEHKTVKARGAIQLKVSQPVQDAFDHFVPMVKSNTSHGFLLTTLRTKSRCSAPTCQTHPGHHHGAPRQKHWGPDHTRLEDDRRILRNREGGGPADGDGTLRSDAASLRVEIDMLSRSAISRNSRGSHHVLPSFLEYV